MIRGLYTSASGMLVEQQKQDTISNNIANVNTAGFKKDVAAFKAFPEMLLERINDAEQNSPSANKRPQIGRLGTGAILDEVVTMHSAGPLRKTDSPLDVAINGEGFFVVDTPQGEKYTRNGSFKLDAENYLVTSEGYRVMGNSGSIRVDGENLQISDNGTIWVDREGLAGQQQKVQAATIRVVNVADKKALTKIGDSLYQGGQVQAVTNPVLIQGFQEQSNVNPVIEMVNMITAMRSYEANQKAVQAHDQLLEKAANEVGRL